MSRSLYCSLFFALIMCNTHAQRVGIVLSGGGVRGFAHIGVLKALEENQIPIDYITGTSAGALVGSMYATGLTPQQMEINTLSDEFREYATGAIDEDLHYYFKETDEDASWLTLKFSYDSIIRTHLPSSIVNSAAVDFALLESTTAASQASGYDFNNLFVPFRCVASDIKNKRPVIFNCGDLSTAIRSSFAYPLYFSPVAIDNKIMFDGGIYNNFPSDVMLNDFEPDIIIGVNAGTGPELAGDDNILSQFKTMIMQSQVYALPGIDDIMISPELSNVSVFDFNATKAAIDSGYAATMRAMDDIKEKIARRKPVDELNDKRLLFLQKYKPVLVDKINVLGVNIAKAAYIKKILKNTTEPVRLKQLKPYYFKLIADENIRSIFPRLTYNEQTGYYDMDLYVKQESDLRVDVGGNFSTRPISELYLGLDYNLLGKQSLSLNGNAYIGKFYNSIQTKARIDFPGQLDFFTEPYFAINRYDYFKSSTAFYEDIKPSYLVYNDLAYGINAGIPARNKGKVIINGGIFNIKNEYYQTRDFSVKDTADETTFNGFTFGLNFDRNTLDRKMYASKGTLLNIKIRYIEGDEATRPGSTSPLDQNYAAYHRWWQLKMVYDNYFKSLGPVKLGFYSEMNFSGQPFFKNYTATSLLAPAFEPTQESKTLFLENFRSHNYIGLGLKNIFTIKSNIEVRLEGYAYQPFQQITVKDDGGVKYTDAFSTRYYIASLATIYQSPLGPIALNLNYYDRKQNSFTFMFHFGYILFNKKALD